MIRHIVMFQLKEFASPDEKLATMEAIKDALEALPGKIDVLRSIRVDFNINPSEAWDMVLTAGLDSLEDVRLYADHPAHTAVATNLIAPVKINRACVDCEV
ncbi:MAG: Dabb family protein [Tannerellaceae bacterium]|nr:Dabb family protein [Tannerellaceae bacterium]